MYEEGGGKQGKEETNRKCKGSEGRKKEENVFPSRHLTTNITCVLLLTVDLSCIRCFWETHALSMCESLISGNLELVVLCSQLCLKEEGGFVVTPSYELHTRRA